MPESLVWKQEGLKFGDWTAGPNSDSVFEFSTQLEASDRVQNNGSLYLHYFLVREGKSPDPGTGKGMFSKKWTAYKKQRLNKFMKRKYKKTANLITGATEQTEEEQAKAELGLTEIISHWHPNLTVINMDVNLIRDHYNCVFRLTLCTTTRRGCRARCRRPWTSSWSSLLPCRTTNPSSGSTTTGT